MSKNDLSTARMRGCAAAWARRAGERHSYGELVAGLSCVLRAEGVIATGTELSNLLHDPLVSLDAEKHDAAFVARAVDSALKRDFTRPETDVLPYEFQDRYRGQSHRRISIGGGLASEVAKHLKDAKIRRGTKQFKEFVTKNTGQVLGAAQKEAQAEIARAKRETRAAVRELEKKVSAIAQAIARLQRIIEILEGLLSAAGLPTETVASKAVTHRIELFRGARTRLREQIRHDEQVVRDLDPQVIAIESLRQFPDLRPFLGEAE